MKKDKEYTAKYDAKQRAKGLYKPSIWVHESWKGTKQYEQIKRKLGDPVK